MNDKTRTRTGGCLCEGVRYTLVGACRDVVNCFCGQCRKTTGHHFASTNVLLDQFKLVNDATLSWYDSSEMARRGFCSRCGSSLFWQRFESDSISIAAGTIDNPTYLKTTKNIFVQHMGDYHELPPLSCDESVS